LPHLLTFEGGMVGLLYDKILPEHQESDESRALINRVTGLVATMAALVLGLLIAFFSPNQRGNVTIATYIEIGASPIRESPGNRA
jgi:hypothetical protein